MPRRDHKERRRRIGRMGRLVNRAVRLGYRIYWDAHGWVGVGNDGYTSLMRTADLGAHLAWLLRYRRDITGAA